MNFDIETSRLILRKFKLEDIDDLMKYRNNLEWMKYQEFKGLNKEEYIDIIFESFDINKGIQLALELKESNQLVGDVYLRRNGKLLYLGYSLNEQFCHLGYMHEILKELVQKALNNGYSLKAEVIEENKNSIRLLEKLNFKLKGKNVYNELVYLKNNSTR